MRLRNIFILLAVLLALGGYFHYSSRPEPAPPPELRPFVWSIEDEEIEHIEIRLPRENKSEAFIKEDVEDKFPWYFDDPKRSEIDTERWGGGIPLLLSGPGAYRMISENATEEQLTSFGLTQPQMDISLTLEDGTILNITVGDRAPVDSNFYVHVPGTKDIAMVDFTWYAVLERLVKEPPYAAPPTD